MSFVTRIAITTTAIVFALAAFTSEGAAQSDFMGGIHFGTGLPQGELDDQLGREAYGIGGQLFYAPSTSPLAIGLDISWSNYGTETREEPFSSTIPDVVVDVERSNNFAQALFVLRGQVRHGPIQPYGDALIGVNYLYTETSVNSGGFGDEVASSTNKDDAALAYGFGGGVMVPVWSNDFQSDNIKQVLLDAGVRYVKGGEAEYFKKGAVKHSDGTTEFETVESRTDMLKLHLGVMLRF